MLVGTMYGLEIFGCLQEHDGPEMAMSIEIVWRLSAKGRELEVGES